MTPTRHWGIVGGGILGMTLAWELVKLGNRVSLFEAGPEAGGLASACRLGDIVWDRYYHVTLPSDSALRSLLAELDLDRDMQWRRTATGFFCNGGLCSFSGMIDFARFPLLSPVEKLRLGIGIYQASRVPSSAPIEGLTVEQWLTGLSGARVFNRFWRPLLRSKLGDDYRSTSASFMLATIRRMFAARGSGPRAEGFGYLPGGYARMLEAFVAALQYKGVCVYLNARACQVAPAANHGTTIAFTNGAVEKFDRVVLTAPAPLVAPVCPHLSPAELDSLRKVEYRGVICVSLLLKRSLSPFYITNIVDDTIPLTGVIEMSNLVDREWFQGHALVYLPRYVRPDDPAFCQSDDRVRAEFFAALRRMYPSVSEDDIVASRVSRARFVFARPTPGSSARLPSIDTSLTGIHILNSAHITDGTLNVNETVQLAQRQARRLHEFAA